MAAAWLFNRQLERHLKEERDKNVETPTHTLTVPRRWECLWAVNSNGARSSGHTTAHSYRSTTQHPHAMRADDVAVVPRADATNAKNELIESLSAGVQERWQPKHCGADEFYVAPVCARDGTSINARHECFVRGRALLGIVIVSRAIQLEFKQINICVR